MTLPFLSPKPRSDVPGDLIAPRAQGRNLNVLGVHVSVVSLPDAAEAVVNWAREGRPPEGPRYVCATSVHGVVEAQRDAQFRDILNGAALVVPDGVPLVWFGRLAGRPEIERVYGPALALGICERAAGYRLRHYFYGGAPGVADQLAERLSSRFPGLEIAGTYCPPFRLLEPRELHEVAATINRARPHIVWVGLSTPKQERWIARVRAHLNTGVLVSVGAAFDFLTERVRQAPAWLQQLGMEWAFRLAQEPRRLWRRYARNNPTFVYLAALQLAGLRKFSD